MLAWDTLGTDPSYLMACMAYCLQRMTLSIQKDISKTPGLTLTKMESLQRQRLLTKFEKNWQKDYCPNLLWPD